MKAAPSPRERPHRTPGPKGRVSQQRRRSPEPDCPHRSSPPGTRETASSARDRPLNEAPHLIPPQIAAESYSANQIIQCVFTQRRPKADVARSCFHHVRYVTTCLAPPNRGGLNSTHIHGTSVEEPSTASKSDIRRISIISS